MKLATIRTSRGTQAVRVEEDRAVSLGLADVGAVLQREDWEQWSEGVDGEEFAIGDLNYAPLILAPSKILCVGLNYKAHANEGGKEPPDFPALFTKYPETLIGANDDIILPPESEKVDWEAELTFVIGRRGRRIPESSARDHIAGYTIMNDVSARDWQRRTTQWFAGKGFEATSPLGPWLVTDGDAGNREVVCEVDETRMQDANTSDLVHGVEELVTYISTILTLNPGDVVATGTPSGVGNHQTPPRFLRSGELVRTAISGLGECRNFCR